MWKVWVSLIGAPFKSDSFLLWRRLNQDKPLCKAWGSWLQTHILGCRVAIGFVLKSPISHGMMTLLNDFGIYHRLDSCKIPSNHNRILCRYRTAMLCIFLISLFNMTHWPTYTHSAIRGLLLFLVSGQLIGQSEHVTFFNINHHDLFFPCVEHFSSIQQSSIM